MLFRLTVLIFSILLAACVQAREAVRIVSPGRVSLLAHVVLRANSFTLADLLPGSAPSPVYSEAAKIALGQAPQPTASRIIYRQQLQFLLKDDAFLLGALRFPGQITIQRYHRALTKNEIVQAIGHAIGNQSAGQNSALDLQNIQFCVPIYVTQDDAGLKVLRIESDPLRHETRFRLWTANDPGNLPFTVTAQRDVKLPTLVTRRMLSSNEVVSATDFAVEMRPETRELSGHSVTATDLAGLETRASIRVGQPVTREQFTPAVLVKPGALATLIVEGAGFSIKAVVTPLQQGVLGQQIPVRNPETSQVVEAKVVGRDRLLKTF